MHSGAGEGHRPGEPTARNAAPRPQRADHHGSSSFVFARRDARSPDAIASGRPGAGCPWAWPTPTRSISFSPSVARARSPTWISRPRHPRRPRQGDLAVRRDVLRRDDRRVGPCASRASPHASPTPAAPAAPAVSGTMRGLILSFAFAMAPMAAGAQILLPVSGGPGGGQFAAPCPSGQNLAALEVRGADDVDAVRPVCAAQGPRPAGAATSPGAWHGGGGGSFVGLMCPPSTPVVLSLYVAWEARTPRWSTASRSIAAAPPQASRRPATIPTRASTGRTTSHPQRSVRWVRVGYDISTDAQTCPPGQVAVGIHGRSGVWLDAIGLMCDAPRLQAASAPGRVNRGSPAPARSLCDAAASARARNSPTAANLTAQCQAYQASRPPPVSSLGRVNRDSPSPAGSLCDAAASARARNSPVAAHLEEQCQAAGGPPAPPADPPGEDPPPEGAAPCTFEATRKLALGLLLVIANRRPGGQAAAKAYLPALGGRGGGQFDQACGLGSLLGFELRVGDDVDAIRPICAVLRANGGQSTISFPTRGSGLQVVNTERGPETQVAAEWHGGIGGRVITLRCPPETPVVLGMDVGWGGRRHDHRQ